jgi:hypothetical protein
MVGGVFQGANAADFSDAVTLYTVAGAPPEGVMTAQAVSNSTAFRYVRYLSPTNGFCNVAEVAFYGTGGSPTPTPTPTPTPPAAPAGLTATPGNGQVVLGWNATSGAASYTVKVGLSSGGPYVTGATVAQTTYTDTSLTNGTTYYYVVSASNTAGEGANSSQASATPSTGGGSQLTGTVIGTPGSYANSQWTVDKVFDGNLATFFDAPAASGAWAGLDLGTAHVITQIKYCPRSTQAGRMVGGVFQGSNSADFNGAVTLFTVTAAPADGTMTAQAISNGTPFRYVRYLSPTNGFCNIAEISFW